VVGVYLFRLSQVVVQPQTKYTPLYNGRCFIRWHKYLQVGEIVRSELARFGLRERRPLLDLQDSLDRNKRKRDQKIWEGDGAKENSQTQAFNGQTGATLGGSFTAFPANIKLPVNVAAKDLDGDDIIDKIFAALGSASANVPIKRYLPNGQPSPQGVDFVLETDKAFSYGIQLA
jgi:hypothetical protein